MGIGRAALVIMAGNVASRALGFGREIVIAYLFGASAATDAFRVASRIPTSLYDLLVGGLISAALVPVLSGYADTDRRDFYRITSLLLSLVLVVLIPVSALMMLGADWLIRIYAAGLDPATELVAVDMVRIMLPALCFQGVSGVLTAAHYAARRFAAPALSLSIFNLGIILGAVSLAGVIGPLALVLGVLGGAAGQAVALVLGLRGFRYSLSLSWSHPAVRKILVLSAPVALGLVVDIAARLIDTRLATATGEGNLAALVFATTLVQLPLGLVATAVSFAILPTLARVSQPVVEPANTPLEDIGETVVAANHAGRFAETLGLGLKLVAIAIVPATLILVLARYPVVQLLFERGEFDLVATEKTALAFLAYAPGLPAAAIDQVLIFAFYARRNTLAPVLVGIAAIGVYLAAAFPLSAVLGFAGLALANSAQWIAHTLILGALLWRTLGSLGPLRLGATALKVLAAGLALTAVVWPLAALAGLDAPGTHDTLPLLAATLLVTALGLAAYVGLLLVLRVDELATARQLVANRLKRPAR